MTTTDPGRLPLRIEMEMPERLICCVVVVGLRAAPYSKCFTGTERSDAIQTQKTDMVKIKERDEGMCFHQAPSSPMLDLL